MAPSPTDPASDATAGGASPTHDGGPGIPAPRTKSRMSPFPINLSYRLCTSAMYTLSAFSASEL
jgi:hypothetical protein